MKNDIFYWSPFLGKVATVRSVINSMIGLKRYTREKFKVYLINCYGEWNIFQSRLKKEKIYILELQKFFKINVNLFGYITSRLIYFLTLVISYHKLKFLLISKQPKFLIIHLLTYIPLLLYLNNNFKTKLILRISGKPELNMLRTFLWRISNKNISLVFCPTIETMKLLKKKNIFDKKKIKFIPDPILFEEEIKKLKSEKIKFRLKKNSFFLCIGRLTRQKNHQLILNFYRNYKIKEKLLIIGEGELKNYLIKLIKKFNLKKKIIILDYQKNIYHYINDAKAIIIPSLWEDPGFVMIESAFSKKPIICSDCPSGPKEFVGKNEGGFLFKSNSLTSLKNSFENFLYSNKADLNKKIQFAKNKSKIYTIENHTKMICRYLK